MTTGKQETLQKSWKHGVAGCSAGLASVLLLQPLDVIKTRLQALLPLLLSTALLTCAVRNLVIDGWHPFLKNWKVQDGLHGILPAYRGTLHALQSIVKEEGWRALYSGLSPALIGAGLSWGFYFAAYNNAKQRWQRVSGQEQLSPAHHLLAAAEGGAFVCFLTNPVWVVKTRLQLQRGAGAMRKLAVPATAPRVAAGAAASTPAHYQGFTDCLRQIAREEGIRGLYRGLGPSLLLVSHGAIQFMVYEELKRLMGKRHAEGGKQALTSLEITLIGAASKLFATVSTYPSSVIRARLQQRQQLGRPVYYKNGWMTLHLILRREGFWGLYKGVVPTVLRVMPSSAITLLVYEKLMQQMLKLDF